MKKFLSVLGVAVCIAFSAHAQDTTKIKKTSSPTQKVHNTLSKHKHYNGYKVKKDSSGVEKKTKVNTSTGEVKRKEDK